MATNRDKITNKQFAQFIYDGTLEPCKYCIQESACNDKPFNRELCIQNIETWLVNLISSLF